MKWRSTNPGLVEAHEDARLGGRPGRRFVPSDEVEEVRRAPHRSPRRVRTSPSLRRAQSRPRVHQRRPRLHPLGEASLRWLLARLGDATSSSATTTSSTAATRSRAAPGLTEFAPARLLVDESATTEPRGRRVQIVCIDPQGTRFVPFRFFARPEATELVVSAQASHTTR
jgi:hypothetical protein